MDYKDEDFEHKNDIFKLASKLHEDKKEIDCESDIFLRRPSLFEDFHNAFISGSAGVYDIMSYFIRNTDQSCIPFNQNFLDFDIASELVEIYKIGSTSYVYALCMTFILIRSQKSYANCFIQAQAYGFMVKVLSIDSVSDVVLVLTLKTIMEFVKSSENNRNQIILRVALVDIIGPCIRNKQIPEMLDLAIQILHEIINYKKITKNGAYNIAHAIRLLMATVGRSGIISVMDLVSHCCQYPSFGHLLQKVKTDLMEYIESGMNDLDINISKAVTRATSLIIETGGIPTEEIIQNAENLIYCTNSEVFSYACKIGINCFINHYNFTLGVDHLINRAMVSTVNEKKAALDLISVFVLANEENAKEAFSCGLVLLLVHLLDSGDDQLIFQSVALLSASIHAGFAEGIVDEFKEAGGVTSLSGILEVDNIDKDVEDQVISFLNEFYEKTEDSIQF